MSNIKPRWQYRFENFSRALKLLAEAIDLMRTKECSMLEKEGIIQRFEYSWELAWKVIKDFLEFQGVHFETVTPAIVIREALAAQLIDNGDVWMKALAARNAMSHTYDVAGFEEIISSIAVSYLPVMQKMHEVIARKL